MSDLADGTIIKIREYDKRIAELEGQLKRAWEANADVANAWAVATKENKALREAAQELARRCDYYTKRGGEVPPMIASSIDALAALLKEGE